MEKARYKFLIIIIINYYYYYTQFKTQDPQKTLSCWAAHLLFRVSQKLGLLLSALKLSPQFTKITHSIVCMAFTVSEGIELST